MRKHLFLILFSILTLASCAQSKQTSKSNIPNSSEEKLFKEAITESRRGNLQQAHDIYSKIITNHPDFIKAYLMKGGLYFRSQDWNNARNYFNQAIAIDPNFDIEVYYSLALLENNEKNYAKAAEILSIYIEKSNEQNPKLEKANELFDLYQFKAKKVANPVSFNKERLPFPINTDHSEYVPLFTADGRFMIFVRRINQQEDLYISEYKDGKFSMPKIISEISTLENEGVHSISADGRTLVFTGCNRRDSYGSCDLYYTNRKSDGNWSIPSNMGKLVNSIFWDSQPSLSADGKTLYFSSTREGSIGGRDIWVTSKDETGRWKIPKNISGAINTLGNDETPFIHADGKTLYYRSNGRLGMGGYDMYWSKYDSDMKEWTIPQNLGYPINTEADEGGLTIDLKGEMAYYSSNENGKDVDIFRFPLPDDLKPRPVTFIAGTVLDQESGKPLLAEISINAYNKKEKTTILTNDVGDFLHALPVGESYGFSIEKEGYLFYSEYIGLDSIFTAIKPYEITIYLRPIQQIVENIQPIILNNIFFETGSAILEPRSQAEIKKLAELLESNPEMKIKIIGHTDNIGSESDNLDLSINRAKAVVGALVSMKINKSRLTADGLGESKPVSTNDTQEGRQKNRRTEFIIIGRN